MSTVLVAAFASLGGLVLGMLSDMVSEEVRARLDRLPQAIVGLAVLRLPCAVRDATRHDWLADLDILLHGDEAVPVTRLFKGVSFGLSLLFSASKMGKELEILGKRQREKEEAKRIHVWKPDPITRAWRKTSYPPESLIRLVDHKMGESMDGDILWVHSNRFEDINSDMCVLFKHSGRW